MVPRTRTKEVRLKINGQILHVVTVAGLGEIIGKSRNTILRYETKDVFPLAPLVIKGVRYYPLSLAEGLKEVVGLLPLHKKPDPSLIVRINQLFKEASILCQGKK